MIKYKFFFTKLRSLHKGLIEKNTFIKVKSLHKDMINETKVKPKNFLNKNVLGRIFRTFCEKDPFG